MNSNKLQLNTDKTEVMPVGSASRVALVESECANIGGNSVPFKMSVKYLGVHLDQTLSSGSTSTAFVAHLSWSFDEPQQSDHISPKVPLQACRGNDHFSS